MWRPTALARCARAAHTFARSVAANMQKASCTLAGAALALLLTACFPSENGETRFEEQQIPAVEAVQVREGTLPLEERLAGSVVSRNQTEIYAEVSGRIVEVLANDGDQVEAGAPLVRLRASEFEEQLLQSQAALRVADARVKQAEANNTRAQAALQRMETIVSRNLGSAAELETAQAEALSAEAELLLMQAQRQQAESLVEERRSALDRTTIRAPITGIVGARNAEIGQLATTSTPLFVIGDPGAMRVTVTLTQRMLGYIETGTPVNILSDVALNQPMPAKISRISPFLHPVTRTTSAEIDVEGSNTLLRPGMFVTVDVLYGQSPVAALVPNNAIYTDARQGTEGVWIADVDAANAPLERGAGSVPRDLLDPSGPVTVEFVPIEIVARGRLASAVRGLEPGQWVVSVGHELLSRNDTGRAVIQPTPWEHIMRLQQMQTRDLLDLIERKQAETAEAL
jgi:HlyD family secretion protein